MSAPIYGGTRPASSSHNEALVREQYRGIRPAPGYPACPDHSLKPNAVRPARGRGECDRHHARPTASRCCQTAAVSGFYFGHARRRLFRRRARSASDQLAKTMPARRSGSISIPGGTLAASQSGLSARNADRARREGNPAVACGFGLTPIADCAPDPVVRSPPSYAQDRLLALALLLGGAHRRACGPRRPSSCRRTARASLAASRTRSPPSVNGGDRDDRRSRRAPIMIAPMQSPPGVVAFQARVTSRHR